MLFPISSRQCCRPRLRYRMSEFLARKNELGRRDRHCSGFLLKASNFFTPEDDEKCQNRVFTSSEGKSAIMWPNLRLRNRTQYVESIVNVIRCILYRCIMRQKASESLLLDQGGRETVLASFTRFYFGTLRNTHAK